MLDTLNGRRGIAEVENLKVYFNSKRGLIQAVDGVSFHIVDGETLGLVGETGCGKSVTGRSFLRLLPVPPGVVAGGSVKFQPRGKLVEKRESVDLLTISDEEIRRLRGDRIAMIFQDPGKALNPTLTIGSQIAEVFLQHRSEEVLEMAGIKLTRNRAVRRFVSHNPRAFDNILLMMPGARQQKKQINGALEKMVSKALLETQVPNPSKLMDRYPHELSGGMRQRVMIAQALACNPDLLIADEPTTALDVTVEAKIIELISELQKRKKTSVLYISHDLSLVRRICDRVAVMYAGRIVEVGQTEDIFSNPRHPYTRGLMAAVPAAGTPRGGLSAIGGTVPEFIAPPIACRFSTRCPHQVADCRSNDPKLENLTESHAVACFIDNPLHGANNPSYEKQKQ